MAVKKCSKCGSEIIYLTEDEKKLFKLDDLIRDDEKNDGWVGKLSRQCNHHYSYSCDDEGCPGVMLYLTYPELKKFIGRIINDSL